MDKLNQCLTHLAVDGPHIGIKSEWGAIQPPNAAPVSSYEVNPNNVLEADGTISPYCEDVLFNELCGLFGHSGIDKEYILSLPDTNVQSTFFNDSATGGEDVPGTGYWPPQECKIFDNDGHFINTVSSGNGSGNKQVDSVKCTDTDSSPTTTS